jgi:hypothetical protein
MCYHYFLFSIGFNHFVKLIFIDFMNGVHSILNNSYLCSLQYSLRDGAVSSNARFHSPLCLLRHYVIFAAQHLRNLIETSRFSIILFPSPDTYLMYLQRFPYFTAIKRFHACCHTVPLCNVTSLEY